MTSTAATSIPTTLHDVDRLVLSHPRRAKAFPGHSDAQIRAVLTSAYLDGRLHIFAHGIVIAAVVDEKTLYIEHILQWSPGLINLAMQSVRKHAPHMRIVGKRRNKEVDFTEAYG